MIHKIGDKVRIKILPEYPRFSGELAFIESIGSSTYGLQLKDKVKNSENRILLTEDLFINVSQFDRTEENESINFNFNIPIEAWGCDLFFDRNGKTYRVKVERQE